MGPFLLLFYLHLSTDVQCELCTYDRCEYHFDVHWARTMTYLHKPTDTVYNVEPVNGELRITGNSIGLADPADPLIGTSVSARDVISGDGSKRNVIAINGRFPGPEIHVMEGAEVVVHVKNSLIVDALAIHWHGMHQRKSYWSDGVPFVTQYPVPPRTSYKYSFRADPAGTHWYHSHLSFQRMDGLYGALIVHPHGSPVPSHVPVMMLSEMYRYEGRTIRLMQEGVPEMVQHSSHTDIPEHHLHSILVNGRGRKDPDNEAVPWSVLTLKPDTQHRVHVIHAGADYAYKVCIDDHPIRIIAMDGYDIEPVEADLFYIYPGESLDFEFVESGIESGSYWVHVEGAMLHEAMGHGHSMNAAESHESTEHRIHHKRDAGHQHAANADSSKDIQEITNNWETPDPAQDIYKVGSDGLLEQSGSDDAKGDPSQNESHTMQGEHGQHSSGGQTERHHMQGRAILWYEIQNLPEVPQDREKFCSRCKVFNCPAGLSSDPTESCITPNDIKGNKAYQHIWQKLKLGHNPDFRLVVNSIFSGKPGASGSSINGKKFVMPVAPIYEPPAFEKACSECKDCGSYCTNIAELPSDAVVELILSNVQNNQEIYAHHPIHMHGHSFVVLRVVYPTFEDGKWKVAAGISCEDEYCDKVVYSGIHDEGQMTSEEEDGTILQSHHHRKRDVGHDPPQLQPVIKDTILVPARGYVVARILTDNPGTWFLHCHVTQHFDDGMAMLLNVHPRPPYPLTSQACVNGVTRSEKSDPEDLGSQGIDPGKTGAQKGSGASAFPHWILFLDISSVMISVCYVYRPGYMHL